VYFPQVLEWFAKLDSQRVCDFLERWPWLEELQKVPCIEGKKFFRHRRGRHGELTAWRMQGISQARPAIGDRAVIEAKQTVVQVIAPLLRKYGKESRHWTARSPRPRKSIPIFSFFNRCQEQGQPWRRACWPLWVRNAIAMPVPQRYSSTAGLRRERRKAGSGKRKWVHFRLEDMQDGLRVALFT